MIFSNSKGHTTFEKKMKKKVHTPSQNSNPKGHLPFEVFHANLDFTLENAVYEFEKYIMTYFGKCEKRSCDLLKFLIEKVCVPMFWNRCTSKVTPPLIQEKHRGGMESIYFFN